MKQKRKNLTTVELAKIIIEAVVALAALIIAIRWW